MALLELQVADGRSAFLVFIGFFACGAGAGGYLTGFVALIDAAFHLYVRKRNPLMESAIREDNRRRMAGEGDGTDMGAMGKLANFAANDPNKAMDMAKQGGEFAKNNPGMAQAAMNNPGIAQAAMGGRGGGSAI